MKKSRLPMMITGIVLVVLLIGLAVPVSVRAYKKALVKGDGRECELQYLFDRDSRDASEAQAHDVIIHCNGNQPDRLEIVYSADRSNWTALEMNRAGNTSVYAASLPAREKGKKWFFRFEAVFGTSRSEFNLSPDKDFYVVYEGAVPKFLLILHVALMILTALLVLHAFQYSLEVVFNGTGIEKAYRSALFAMIAFFISAFALGPPISGYTFGAPFGPWPFGTDITDTKSVFLALFWLVPLILKAGVFTANPSHHRISDRTFAFWALGGLAVSLIVYLIPHSLFIQN